MGDKDTVSTSANLNSELNSKVAEPEKSWEKKLIDESPKAFKAFCLFRAMGYKRSIKACMEMHGMSRRSTAPGHVTQGSITGMNVLQNMMPILQRRLKENYWLSVLNAKGDRWKC